MERYYDGDQEALFKSAHVINPYVKPKKEAKVMTELVFVRHVARCHRPSYTTGLVGIACVCENLFHIRCSHGRFREKLTH